MSVTLIATLVGLGFVGGFFAGLLGFGGGVLMFPLLFYVPPLLGLVPMDVKTVAAIVASQVFFSTLTGGTAHLRSGQVQGRLTSRRAPFRPPAHLRVASHRNGFLNASC